MRFGTAAGFIRRGVGGGAAYEAWRRGVVASLGARGGCHGHFRNCGGLRDDGGAGRCEGGAYDENVELGNENQWNMGSYAQLLQSSLASHECHPLQNANCLAREPKHRAKPAQWAWEPAFRLPMYQSRQLWTSSSTSAREGMVRHTWWTNFRWRRLNSDRKRPTEWFVGLVLGWSGAPRGGRIRIHDNTKVV